MAIKITATNIKKVKNGLGSATSPNLTIDILYKSRVVIITMKGDVINNNFLLLAFTAMFSDRPATKNETKKNSTVSKKSIGSLKA